MTIRQTLRSGDWVTRERMRNYSFLMLGVTIFMLGYLGVTSHGVQDYSGRTLGTDFSNVYAAGTYVREGHPQLPYDPTAQFAREQQLFAEKDGFYSWNYPPYFFLIALPLSALPYLCALLLYQLATFTTYLATMRRILPLREAWLPAIGFGAVLVNFGHGNNGFLTATLFGLGLALLRARPLLAGVLLACLIYKPQYGMFIPFALAAGGYWRTFFSAAVTVITLTGITLVVFGIGSWQAFLQSADFTRSVLLEEGNTGFFKMQSLFAWVRAAGGSVNAAYTVQGCVTVLVFCAVIGLWRSRLDDALKAAALILATLLAVPYSFDYDLVVLGVALAFYTDYGLRAGFPPYVKSLLALAWWVPFIARPFAQYTGIFLGPLCLILLFITLLRQWRESPKYGRSPA